MELTFQLTPRYSGLNASWMGRRVQICYDACMGAELVATCRADSDEEVRIVTLPLTHPPDTRTTAIDKVANRKGLARGDRKWPLNDGQIPIFRGVRVALGTGSNRVEGNRRTSRNALVIDLSPEIPHVKGRVKGRLNRGT